MLLKMSFAGWTTNLLLLQVRHLIHIVAYYTDCDARANRDCQVGDYKVHKLVCGSPDAVVLPASAAFEPHDPVTSAVHIATNLPELSALTPALVQQIEYLSRKTADDDRLAYAFYPFPSAATSNTDEINSIPTHAIPIIIPTETFALFSSIFRKACWGNHHSVNLLYSFLSDHLFDQDLELEMEELARQRTEGEVERVDQAERGRLLIAQLSLEYGFDLLAELESEAEPSEEEMIEAVGGEQSLGLLRESLCLAASTQSPH